jgi:hypothetical protein
LTRVKVARPARRSMAQPHQEDPTMDQLPVLESGPRLHAPIRTFSGAHGGIREGLLGLRALPELGAALARARATAALVLDLFDHQVLAHHADEEQELFVAVERSARAGDEVLEVRRMAGRLVDEHRRIERAWARVRPAVVAMAAGKVHGHGEFDGEVRRLVDDYFDHARYEEEVFLPLADAILSRNGNHMAALDVSLHMRRRPAPRGAYI